MISERFTECLPTFFKGSGLSYWITVSSNRVGFGKAFLRNKVIMNKNGFITTLNAYNDEPWLLNHFNNVLFKNEWCYFSQRNRRGVKTQEC